MLEVIRNYSISEIIRNKEILDSFFNKYDIKSVLYVTAIDYRDTKGIEFLIKDDINEDIVLKIYQRNILTPRRLRFILENGDDYFKITENFILNLLIDRDIDLLVTIFKKCYFLKNKVIKNLLNFYNNRTPLSNEELNNHISN